QCTHPELTLRRPTDPPRLSRNGVGLFQGFGLGGFAEQALIHENQLAVIPKELPFPQAALLGCGVATGAGSVLNTANVNAGDTVVIFGAGGVGLKHDIPMYAELYLQGRMNLDDLVSRKISLRNVNDGYAALKDGSLTRLKQSPPTISMEHS